MSSPIQPYSYKSPSLYNPRLWHANEVRAYYVARPALLDRIVDDLKREDANNHPQHRLIVGLRGMGKSTLLRRIAVAVEDDAQLNAAWLPLSFPEEQYNVASLSDFWLNCLDALSDLLESRGQVAESARLDAEVEQLDRKDGAGALGALLRTAGSLQRRLLLLVDNIDLVFERIKNEDWKLREALQAHPEILIVGASAKVLEDSYNYQAAFYDFFKIDELRGLSEAEMRETIVNLARLNKADHIIERIDADPARLRVLHTLTGGNPRTAVLLYGVLLKGIDGDVRSDLEGLLDEVTPLYKARFEELPPQSQQLLDKLALHWHPASAAVLTKLLGWKVNLVSAQLDRLIGAGIVERVKAPKSKRLNFQIGERFFNIWYLMRTSRRLRRRLIWLVECMRGLYSNTELQAIAKQHMAQTITDVRDAETMLALSDALDDKTYKRALTDLVLELVQKDRTGKMISELFDLDGDDKEIKSRHEQVLARTRLRKSISDILTDANRSEILARFDVALLDRKELDELVELVENSEIENFVQTLLNFLEQKIYEAKGKLGEKGSCLLVRALSKGTMFGPWDIDGGAAQAIRLDEPYLAALPRMLTTELNKDSASQVENYCRAVINYDDSGSLPWLVLSAALMLQRKKADVIVSARKLIAIHSAPMEYKSAGLIALLKIRDPEWTSSATSLFEHLNPYDMDKIELLSDIAVVAIELGEGRKYLSVWDKAMPNGELLPFREALNAAAHNDASLLELLAPEVQEPARQFLAVIAPKLLQKNDE